MATVDAELMAAVRELSLESPGMGVKKLAAAVKQRDVQCSTKEVRAALKLLKADATATASPPVSAMDVDVEEGESAAANDDMELTVTDRADADLMENLQTLSLEPRFSFLKGLPSALTKKVGDDLEWALTDTDLTDAELMVDVRKLDREWSHIRGLPIAQVLASTKEVLTTIQKQSLDGLPMVEQTKATTELGAELLVAMRKQSLELSKVGVTVIEDKPNCEVPTADQEPDHDADLAALLAAGKRCMVCAPAVPRDGVRGPVPAHERAGIGLLEQDGDKIMLHLLNKKLDDNGYTYTGRGRPVERQDLATFLCLRTLPSPPRPPKISIARDADALSVAVGLFRPAIHDGKRVVSSLEPDVEASKESLGLLSCAKVDGQMDKYGWRSVKHVINSRSTLDELQRAWQVASADPLSTNRTDCLYWLRLYGLLLRYGLYADILPMSPIVLCAERALANNVANAMDRLLGHAVGVYHPRAAVKDLPQKGGWIGVATGVLEILQRHVEMEDGMRARMLTLVQDCELGSQKEQNRAKKR